MESPDSGHREMSSDSLVFSVIPNDVSVAQANEMYGNGVMPGGTVGSYSGVVNGNVALSEVQRFDDKFTTAVIDTSSGGYQRMAATEVAVTNRNPFITSHSDYVNQNNLVNGFQNNVRNDRENNNKVSITAASSLSTADSIASKTGGGHFGQRSTEGSILNQGHTSSGTKISFSNTEDVAKMGISNTNNKLVENKQSISDTSTQLSGEKGSNINTSAMPSAGALPGKSTSALPNKSTSVLPSKSTSALPSKSASALANKAASVLPSKSASALSSKSSASLEKLNKSQEEVDKAKKEGVLKTLNLNLKSLGSHKRHSSTSAELYRRTDSSESDASAKVAIQSASESRLLNKDKKSSAFAVTPTKS